jgi:hypothetical protein
MNKELWVMVLTFLAAVIVAATQALPIPADLMPWLSFAVIVINLALSIFFGVTGYRLRAAAKAAK